MESFERGRRSLVIRWLSLPSCLRIWEGAKAKSVPLCFHFRPDRLFVDVLLLLGRLYWYRRYLCYLSETRSSLDITPTRNVPAGSNQSYRGKVWCRSRGGAGEHSLRSASNWTWPYIYSVVGHMQLVHTIVKTKWSSSKKLLAGLRKRSSISLLYDSLQFSISHLTLLMWILSDYW